MAAADDRSAIAYLTDHDLVVIAADNTRTVLPFDSHSCLAGHADRLYVAPGGGHSIGVWGEQANIAGDLFGHAGSHTTASCIVDLATRRERALADAGGLLVWRTATDLVAALPDARDRDHCAATGATRACFDRGSGAIVTSTNARYPARDVGELWGVALSADGKRFAYWGRTGSDRPIRNRAIVIDLTSGAELARFDESYNGAIAWIELDPRGSRDLLVVDWLDEGSGPHNGRVRRLTGDGKVTHEHRTRNIPDAAYWTTPGEYWAVESCYAQRVKL